MKKIDITAFKEMVTDYLAGELTAVEADLFNSLIENDETFSNEFRLMKRAWEEVVTAKSEEQVPEMSGMLKDELRGELSDDDLDMVSGGIKADPEVDPDDYDI